MSENLQGGFEFAPAGGLCAAQAGPHGALVCEKVWRMDSRRLDFGGYSALIALGGERLLALSDRTNLLEFSPPDAAAPAPPRFAGILRPSLPSGVRDAESAAFDPDTGRYWVGFEYINGIGRFSPGGGQMGERQLPELADLPRNAGAEAMTRLADGRFVIIPEHANKVIVFAGDPLEDAASFTAPTSLPDGFEAADLAVLPDGRLLLLGRRLAASFPPFSIRLFVADPASLKAGKHLRWEPFADLDDLIPRENYEGLAVSPLDDGQAVLWLISDDNKATFQRTLLAKLVWRANPPRAKGARPAPDAPSEP